MKRLQRASLFVVLSLLLAAACSNQSAGGPGGEIPTGPEPGSPAAQQPRGGADMGGGMGGGMR